MKPRILDLYCGAGLAAIGYWQAGFDIVGIDNKPQPNYPFTFYRADALDVITWKKFVNKFDAIHASPPCQQYSRSTAPYRSRGKKYADLVEKTRIGLEKYELPYIIENVPSAPIRADLKLRGDMFGLKVLRVRNFELGNWMLLQPGIPKQVGQSIRGDFISIYGKQGYRKSKHLPPGWRPNFDQGTGIKTWHYAMGIPLEFKFKDTEISEGIPPAYSKYIGEHLLMFLKYKSKCP